MMKDKYTIKQQIYKGTFNVVAEEANHPPQYQEYTDHLNKKLEHLHNSQLHLRYWWNKPNPSKPIVSLLMLFNRLQKGISLGTYKNAHIPLNIADIYQEKSKYDKPVEVLIKKEFAKRLEKENLPNRLKQAAESKAKEIIRTYLQENRKAIMQDAQKQIDQHFQRQFEALERIKRQLEISHPDHQILQEAKSIATANTQQLFKQEKVSIIQKIMGQ